jgi:PAS domain-containing protein
MSWKERTLYLVQIFRASPLMAVALCVCIGTILWCILIMRRQQVGLDRILTGLLGAISIYEAVRIMKDSGIVLFPGFKKLDGWADFIVAIMYLVAALFLKVSSNERAHTKVRLRLVEANEKTMEVGKGAPVTPEMTPTVFDASPLATYAVDSSNFVVYWNPAAERLLGWRRDEVLGQILPMDIKGHLHDKSGREVEAVVWVSAMRSSGGIVRGTLTIAADDQALQEVGLSFATLGARAELVANP